MLQVVNIQHQSTFYFTFFVDKWHHCTARKYKKNASKNSTSLLDLYRLIRKTL